MIMDFSKLSTSKIHADRSPKKRDIDYDKYQALYESEETDPRNTDFYPTDPEVRRAYILQVWFGVKRTRKRGVKITNSWGDVSELSGTGLELGFNWGGSLKWLLDRYPDVVMDGVDFSSYMIENAPVFKEVFGDRARDFMEASCHEVPKPDETYDFINACSMFEHLPECIYWQTIRECWRLLKPGGLIGVYLDQGRAFGTHLRMDLVDVTVKDMTANGFTRITDYRFMKVK